MTDLNLIQGSDLKQYSNKEIYAFCQECGKRIKLFRRVFAVLLIEVYRRRLHRRYGFESIYEFAAKIGGMGKNLVWQIISLANFLKDKPCLWEKFRNLGWSKVRVVASVATEETDNFWASKIELLTKPALESFVRDWRRRSESIGIAGLSPVTFPKNEDKNPDSGFKKPINGMVQNFGESSLAPNYLNMRFRVSPETELKFNYFKQKLRKERHDCLTSGEVLRILLEKAEELEQLKKSRNKSVGGRRKIGNRSQRAGSKYVSVQTQNGLKQEYDIKCAMPWCNKPAEHFHHTQRFSLTRSHKKIKPLCKICHEFAHAGLIGNENGPAEECVLLSEPELGNSLIEKIDRKVRDYRLEDIMDIDFSKLPEILGEIC